MSSTPNYRLGVLSAVGAYGIWGFLPIYWKQVAQVPVGEILSHRIVWSLVFFSLLLRFYTPGERKAWTARVWLAYLVSGWLIGANWLVFVWAVTSGHVLQSSLGYFLTPLATVSVGAVFFGERLTSRQMLAVGLAVAGAGVLVVRAAEGIWIALLLTLTFCLYGVARRLAPLPSVQGMFLETLMLTPLGLAYFAWAGWAGNFHLLTASLSSRLLLFLAGPVTGIPLLLFSEAARRLPLSHLGLFQYISPSLQFLLAVAYYHEKFTVYNAWSFGLIWTGLLIFVTAPRPPAN